MFLNVAQHVPNIKEIVKLCLKSNPYEGMSEAIINLLVNLIMLTIEPNPSMQVNMRERNFMMIIKDLHELAKNGERPNLATQLEFRYNLWKKNKSVPE